MVALRNTSKRHNPRDFERYVTRHVQSVFRPDAKWRCPGVQVVADGLVSGQPGGDFHVAALGPRNEVWLAVGTVKGDGLLPMLCKALIAGLIHSQARRASSPIVVAQKVSDLLERINTNLPRSPVFCSMFVALIDRRRETFEYCRDGGCHPFVQTPHGEWLELPATCWNLGCAAGTDADVHAFVLDACQIKRLAVVTEGCSAGGDGIGINADTAFVSSVPQGSASRQVQAILAKICRGRNQSAFPERDVSVVVADLCCPEDSDAVATNHLRATEDRPRNRRNGRCR